MQFQRLDEVTHVLDHQVVRHDPLLAGRELLAHHPLQQPTLHADCIDTELGAMQTLHDQPVHGAVHSFVVAQLHLVRFGQNLSHIGVTQKVTVRRHLPVEAAVDSTPRLLDDFLVVFQSPTHLDERPNEAERFDSFGAVRIVSQRFGEHRLVVDEREALRDSDSVYRAGADVRQVECRRGQRPVGIDPMLVDESVELRSGPLRVLRERRQRQSLQAHSLSHFFRRRRQDESHTGPLRRLSDPVHAVARAEQNGLLHSVSPL